MKSSMSMLLLLGSALTIPAAAAAAEKTAAPKEKKVCRVLDDLGTILPKRVCRLAKDWALIDAKKKKTTQGGTEDLRNEREGMASPKP